jgi:phosphoribosylformylglycinamidine synthase
MSFRFEIIPFIGYQDGRASSLKKHFNAKNVTVIEVYTVDKDFDNTQKRQILKYFEKPFYPKLVLDGASYPKFEYAVEIGFLAGVTDNVGNTAKQIIQDALMTRFNEEEAVYSSVLYLVSGVKDIKKFAESLYNPLIQYLKIKKYDEFIKDGGMGLYLPKVKLDKNLRVDEVDIINADDKTLEDIGKNGIKNSDGTSRGPLGMRLEYMLAVKDYFIKQGRNPTDIELETIAQTWSEHCKHTIFAASIDDIKDGLYKHYIKRATKEIRKAKGAEDICVSVFSDNSGAIKLNNDYFITDKMETHNSPSALDPFGGAITGIVGVNRDTIGFGLGAKPFINRYGFCFPYPDKDYNYYRSKGRKNKILPPDFIMKGVINGIKVGGNCSGIPTNSGFVYFDDRFCGKPLVFAGTLGIIPAKIGERNSYEKCAKPKDKVVMIGGRVGKDGIHGATFSSESLNENSPKTAVQIGDPITQKKLSDFIIKEARDKGLYNSITDNGAGGLSSSVGEMAEQSGGVIVDLDRVPLKYQVLQAWEIWISESQERMTLAVPSDKLEEFLSLAYKREIEACVIGEFTDSGKIIIKYNNKTVLDMDMDFLHEGLPKTHLLTKQKSAKEENEPKISKEGFIDNLLKMLSRPNICSKEFLSHLYHEVQGGSVLKPIQGKGRVNSEATVTRPLLDKTQGIVVSSNVNPRYSDIDTYKMAACTIDNAIKSCISAGANPNKIALMDNFCWCSSDEPERLFELKRAAQACYDYACDF